MGTPRGTITSGLKEQIAYARSQVIRSVHQAFQKDLREIASQSKFMTFKPGTLPPIRHYREKQLETSVLCENCTLKYMIYGVFAFCPDCRSHNSLTILTKNLELAEKQLVFAAHVDAEFGDHLIADALENAVSSFDGFGRDPRMAALYVDGEMVDAAPLKRVTDELERRLRGVWTEARTPRSSR